MTRRVAAIVAAVVVVVVAAAVLDRSRVEVDVTEDRSLSLTGASLDVVRELEERARITAFLSRREAGRAEAAALLERYRRASSRITYRLLDPADAPGELRRLGVDPALGGVAVEAGGAVERAPTVSEQDVTSALARIVRDVDAAVCFTSGHGERGTSSDDIGLSRLADLLADNGYLVREGVNGDDLGSCAAAVVAAPTAEIAADDPLARWLDGGGRALVLTDPESPARLASLLEPHGLAVERGLVLERNPAGHVPGDPATPVVASYRSGFPFVRRLPPAVFPGAQGIRVAADPPEGVAAAAAASTTTGGYVEREPAAPSFGPGDVDGPVALVAAADRSRVERGRIVRSRLVVTGDADLLSNAFVGELGHSLLAVQAMDWLTLQEDLVAVSANLPRPRPLPLTAARITYLRVLMAGIVPAGFLLAGAFAWALRRGA